MGLKYEDGLSSIGWALRVFHEWDFSKIGKTRLPQKHFPKSTFPTKFGGEASLGQSRLG